MTGRVDFQRPGRPGHAACLAHSPTPEVSSASLVDGRPCLPVLAKSTGLQCWSVGLSFGTGSMPATSGHLPRRFSAFFLFCPRNNCKIHVNIYIWYIYITPTFTVCVHSAHPSSHVATRRRYEGLGGQGGGVNPIHASLLDVD
jgi:hypothetical protein